MPVRQMNKAPIRYGSVTDSAKPGQRLLLGRHTSVEAARGAVSRSLDYEAQLQRRAQFWIIEIDPGEGRRFIGLDEWTRRKVIAGPFDIDNKPRR